MAELDNDVTDKLASIGTAQAAVAALRKHPQDPILHVYEVWFLAFVHIWIGVCAFLHFCISAFGMGMCVHLCICAFVCAFGHLASDMDCDPMSISNGDSRL